MNTMKIARRFIVRWLKYKALESEQRGLRNVLLLLMDIDDQDSLTLKHRGITYNIHVVRESERIYIEPTPEILALLDTLGIQYKTKVKKYLSVSVQGD